MLLLEVVAGWFAISFAAIPFVGRLIFTNVAE
jgi:hypothetical protein